jgi:beta-phosphoglucomutase
MNKKYKAAIFDLDGVIVDTAKYHYLAWKRLANELGFDITKEDNERQKGVSRMKSLDILLEIGGFDFPDNVKEEMATKKNNWYVEYISKIDSSEILEGAYEFIEGLRQRGIKTAVASASKNAQMILKNIGLLDAFDKIVDGTVVSKAKPDPEVFIVAAKQVGISNEECIVFEDAFAGVEAAVSANMFTVGIGKKEVLFNADMVVTGFAQLLNENFIEEKF